MQYLIILVTPLLGFAGGILTPLIKTWYEARKQKSIPQAHSDESYRKDIELTKMAYALRDAKQALRCCVFLLHNGGIWNGAWKGDWNHKKKITCLYEAPDPAGQMRSISLDFNDRLVSGPIFDWVNRLRESETGIEHVKDALAGNCPNQRTMMGVYGTRSNVSVLVRDESGNPVAIVTVDFAFADRLDEMGVAEVAAECSRIGRQLQTLNIP